MFKLLGCSGVVEFKERFKRVDMKEKETEKKKIGVNILWNFVQSVECC